MFEDLFNFKKEPNNKSEKEDVSDILRDILDKSIIRMAFTNIDEDTYKPIPYVIIEEEVDLFSNSDKFEEVKKGIRESFEQAEEKGKILKNYTIIEIPYNSIEKLFLMESEFSLLNSHLHILPEKTLMLKIYDVIQDEGTTFSDKFRLLALNYGIKIYNLLNPKYKGITWDMYIKDEDMRITSKGAIEKYTLDLFNKYKVTLYKVSED